MSREQEAIALLRDLLPVAEETCKRWPNDDCFLIPTANARNFLSRASVESGQNAAPEQPTPRVDAFYRLHPICEYEECASPGDCEAWLDFARQLERELAAAEKRVQELEALFKNGMGKPIPCSSRAAKERAK